MTDLIQAIRTAQSILATDGHGVAADGLHAVAARITELEAEISGRQATARNAAELINDLEAERETLVDEIESTNGARGEALDERDKLSAVIEQIRQARSNHPECEEHPDGDTISCGWKRAVLDMDATLATADTSTVVQAIQADAWDEGREDGYWNAEHEAMIERGNRSRILNPYRPSVGGS